MEKHASMHPEFWRVLPAANPSARLLFWCARLAQDLRAANVLEFRGARRPIDLRASVVFQAARAFEAQFPPRRAQLRFSPGLPGRGFGAAIHPEPRRDFPEKDLSDRSGPT